MQPIKRWTLPGRVHPPGYGGRMFLHLTHLQPLGGRLAIKKFPQKNTLPAELVISDDNEVFVARGAGK